MTVVPNEDASEAAEQQADELEQKLEPDEANPEVENEPPAEEPEVKKSILNLH